MTVTYDPKQDYYRTNPCSAICDYYGIDWDTVWMHDWSVPYGETREHTLELPKKHGRSTHVHIALYRMSSGTYEAITYYC